MSFGSKMWTKDKLRFVFFGGSIIDFENADSANYSLYP